MLRPYSLNCPTFAALYEMETDDVEAFEKKPKEIGMSAVQRAWICMQIMEAKEPKSR